MKLEVAAEKYILSNIIDSVAQEGGLWTYLPKCDIEPCLENLRTIDGLNIILLKGEFALIECKPDYLIRRSSELFLEFDSEGFVPLLNNSLQAMSDSSVAFENFLHKQVEKGEKYRGKLAIYCNNDLFISNKGHNYTAYKINLHDALNSLSSMGYVLNVCGKAMTPTQIAEGHIQDMYNSFEVIDTEDGVLIEICKPSAKF